MGIVLTKEKLVGLEKPMNKVKSVKLTNPVGLESIVVLMFLTPPKSKSHPPHWTVKSDSNSKTIGDIRKEFRDGAHSDNCWKLSVACRLVQTAYPLKKPLHHFLLQLAISAENNIKHGLLL